MQNQQSLQNQNPAPKPSPRVFLITGAEYSALASDYGGYCLGCGDEASGVEPDARRYECESCGANKVYGAEELLLMGRIQFKE